MIVEIELPDHPDYQLLKRVVGEYAMETLIRIWGHCQSNKRGERWPGRGADYVEVVAKWEGERGTLFRALVDYGWIEVDGNDVIIHNWEEKNAALLSSRKNGAKGGRPRKTEGNNPQETQQKPQVSNSNKSGSPAKNGGSTEHPTKPAVSAGLSQPKPEANPDQTPPVVSCLIPSPPSQASDPHTDDYALAQGRIALLNQLTGAKFNPPVHELDGIVGRLLEVNRDVAGMDRMLRRQVALWKDDPRMRNNLKPSTLFGDKFHDYFGQREQPAVASPNGPFKKNGGGQNDRAEVLQTLTATRRQLANLPEESEERPALESEIETLEAQLA